MLDVVGTNTIYCSHLPVAAHVLHCGFRSYKSYLVDPASSHMLVSKIKPCMSKNKYFILNLRTAHYISYSLFDGPLSTWIPVVILELIHAPVPRAAR